MKLEETLEQNEVQQIKDDQSEDIEFGIDKEDEWVIFKSFTNYSDPAGAIVREITSNAFDAHIEAGVDRDVEITIEEEDDLLGTSSLISFRDFGEGMSPHIIKTIYSRFGKSTKRDRNDAIGAFGFGAKSPLAYQDMFDVITIHEGIKYHYSVHAGEQRPVITLINEEETDEPSGTDVRINIKEGDTLKFKSALQKNLKYFDNIKYDNCGISNDYQILRGKHFIYRVDDTKDHSYDNLHICLGKVHYPLDSSLIDYKNINVGLYFDIGEIPVVWNREGIEYTNKATEKIQEKVRLAREELQDIYDSYFDGVDSIDKLLEFKTNTRLIPLTYDQDGEPIGVKDVNGFISTTTKYKKYDHLKVGVSNDLFANVHVDKTVSKYGNYMSSYLRNIDWDKETIFLMKKGENYSNLKTEFIKDKYSSAHFLRFNNKKKAVRSFMNSFFDSHFTLNPYGYPKEIRQEVVKEAYELYEEIKQFVIDKTEYYSDVEVTEEFEEAYIAQKEAEKKRKEKIFHYLSVKKRGSFDRVRINGNRLQKKFGRDLVIYGFQDDRRTLREVQKVLSRELSWRKMDYVHVIQISMRNERVVQEVLENVHYVHNIKKVGVFQRISRKYNQGAYINQLKNSGINIPGLERSYPPSYITPDEPDLEEKKEVWEKVGKHVKYPLLHYISNKAPDDLIEEYKKTCKYHHVNPILIGKKYIKDHYENQRTEEQ